VVAENARGLPYVKPRLAASSSLRHTCARRGPCSCRLPEREELNRACCRLHGRGALSKTCAGSVKKGDFSFSPTAHCPTGAMQYCKNVFYTFKSALSNRTWQIQGPRGFHEPAFGSVFSTGSAAYASARFLYVSTIAGEKAWAWENLLGWSADSSSWIIGPWICLDH